MKDEILEIMQGVDKANENKHYLPPDKRQKISARLIADMVKAFVEWLMMVITQEFFPQTSDGGNTEYFDYYGKIKQRNDLVTLDELFDYWVNNIREK